MAKRPEQRWGPALLDLPLHRPLQPPLSPFASWLQRAKWRLPGRRRGHERKGAESLNDWVKQSIPRALAREGLCLALELSRWDLSIVRTLFQDGDEGESQNPPSRGGWLFSLPGWTHLATPAGKTLEGGPPSLLVSVKEHSLAQKHSTGSVQSTAASQSWKEAR